MAEKEIDAPNKERNVLFPANQTFESLFHLFLSPMELIHATVIRDWWS